MGGSVVCDVLLTMCFGGVMLAVNSIKRLICRYRAPRMCRPKNENIQADLLFSANATVSHAAGVFSKYSPLVVGPSKSPLDVWVDFSSLRITTSGRPKCFQMDDGSE